MDPGGNPLQDPLSALERHPAGGVPRWPRTLAGRVLRLQPLSVLWLLPSRPSVHPSLPAAAAAYPPQGAPHWLSVDGGRPALPEGPWALVTDTCQLEEDSTGKAIFASGFLVCSDGFVCPFPFCYKTPLICKPCRLEVRPF